MSSTHRIGAENSDGLNSYTQISSNISSAASQLSGLNILNRLPRWLAGKGDTAAYAFFAACFENALWEASFTSREEDCSAAVFKGNGRPTTAA